MSTLCLEQERLGVSGDLKVPVSNRPEHSHQQAEVTVQLHTHPRAGGLCCLRETPHLGHPAPLLVTCFRRGGGTEKRPGVRREQ